LDGPPGLHDGHASKCEDVESSVIADNDESMTLIYADSDRTYAICCRLLELQHVLYQLLPPANNGSIIVVLQRVGLEKKFIKNSPLGLLSPFSHCLTGDTFGYNVIEQFGTVLFRTGDSVALPTVGSEITPMCRATVNKIIYNAQCQPETKFKALV